MVCVINSLLSVLRIGDVQARRRSIILQSLAQSAGAAKSQYRHEAPKGSEQNNRQKKEALSRLF